MNTKSAYQFKLSLPIALSKSACGPCCIAQTLWQLDPHSNISAEAVTKEFVKFNKFSKPFIQAQMEHKGDLFEVPVMFSGNQPLEDAAKAKEIVESFGGDKEQNDRYTLTFKEPNNTEYLPTFLLDRGSDARGIRAFLESKGLMSTLHELKATDQPTQANTMFFNTPDAFMSSLIEALHTLSSNSMIIASVNMHKLPHLEDVIRTKYSHGWQISTHLVCVTGAGKGIVKVLDPAYEANQIELSLDVFVKAVTEKDNGRAHFVYTTRLD